MLSVDDLHAGKHGGNRGRWMGWVVMQMEKSVTGCRTANSPVHCTLTATSQTKASLLQPPFASSEGEQPQQRTNIKPATTAHQLTAASCCSSSELGISLGNGHHYQLLTAAGDRWYHLRPSACGTVYSGWHSEKLGHGIFTLCWKATETTADWDLSLEYFLNGQVQKRNWHMGGMGTRAPVLWGFGCGLRAVWWSDFQCRYRDYKHNREEYEEKKEKTRTEESRIIASLRPVTDFGSPVHILDLPGIPPLHCVQTWE